MGRGRAKAKQTKVARDLKYRPVNMDVASLERELGIKSTSHDSYEEEDPYADLAAAYGVDLDEDELDDDEDQDPRRAV
ncbi:hypothetical protein EDD41_1342 [Luteococcus japonicus]|nr:MULTISPECIES: DUF3073 domain-containing protein [Luteococcus]MDN5562506.1 DUF3073 domain-containing protein [Luteococcus sp.]ROR54151.1 hypothetical protein EDD41_1342 [Luteococcus japonicus]